MTDRYADWILIIAADGEVKETVQQLLALAKSPSEVRAQGTAEFLVPAHLSDAYFAAQRPKPRRRTKKEEGANDGD